MKKEKEIRNSEKMKTSLLFTFALLILTCSAAVPLSWTVETSRVQPAVFEAYQGETLTFEAALQSHGKPLAAPVNYSFFWQTNGMGSTYWEVKVRGEGEQRNNSTVHLDLSPSPTNVLFATWSPEMDVGAKVYNCFIGSPSNNYRAAFQLRLRPSPGALPNALPLPTPVIDFDRVRVLNPPWGSGGGGGGCDTNAVDILANSAVVTNALTVATTNRVAALETATNNLSSSVSGLASLKADRPSLPVTAGNLAALTAAGNLADSGIVTNFILSLRGKQDLRIYMYGYGSRLSSDCLPVSLDGEVVSYSIGRSGYGEHDFPTLVINGEVLCTFTNEGVYDGGYDGLLFNGRSAVLGKYPYLDPASVVDFPTDRIATLADIPMISATDPIFSNEVAAVARTVTPPPSPTLRLYDEVRQCYWIGRMVNGVINWEVE